MRWGVRNSFQILPQSPLGSATHLGQFRVVTPFTNSHGRIGRWLKADTQRRYSTAVEYSQDYSENSSIRFLQIRIRKINKILLRYLIANTDLAHGVNPAVPIRFAQSTPSSNRSEILSKARICCLMMNHAWATTWRGSESSNTVIRDYRYLNKHTVLTGNKATGKSCVTFSPNATQVYAHSDQSNKLLDLCDRCNGVVRRMKFSGND